MKALDKKEGTRRAAAAEARKRCECSEATEQPQAPSQPVTKAVNTQAIPESGHTPILAVPAAVRELLSVRVLESTPPSVLRSVKDIPEAAVLAAVKDSLARALVSALPACPIQNLVSDTTIKVIGHVPATVVLAAVKDPPNKMVCDLPRALAPVAVEAKGMDDSEDTESLTVPRTIDTAAAVMQPESSPKPVTASAQGTRPLGNTPAAATPAPAKDPPSAGAVEAVSIPETLVQGDAPVPAIAAVLKDSLFALPLHPLGDFVSITFAKDFGNAPVAPALDAVKDPPDITPCALSLAPARKFALSCPVDKAGVGEAGGLEGAECTHHGQGSKILTSLSTPDAAVAHALRNGGRISNVSLGSLTPEALPSEAAHILLALVNEDAKGGHELGGQPNVAPAINQLHVAPNEQARTLYSVTRASNDTKHSSPHAPSLLSFSSSRPSVLALVMAYLDSALISAVLRTSITTHLGTSLGEASAPCLAWARKGIGTPSWI
ncbi:hypothetical protein B0H14DRAFT_3499513 [Mycena olivaceomarginata]|nr:hypothetical protein B0H14DRAFT_3499513 [Mycena olivaceomarginata]